MTGMIRRAYHWLLAFLAAVWYRFPSRDIKVMAVTGTKGKSSTVELLGAILERAGFRVAVSNTIRFKIADDSRPNLYKMSMPGRGFMQRFLRQAVDAGCHYAILEMTSQGSVLYRHKFIDLDSFVLTNISPEHIEAHGSYENYVEAKLAMVRDGLSGSRKAVRSIIVNADDQESDRFLALDADRKLTYSIHDAEPYRLRDRGLELTMNGLTVKSRLVGAFNIYNILAASTAAVNEGVPHTVIAETVESVEVIPGRAEKIEAGQDFELIVDYAHTPDSLEKLYRAFRPDPDRPRGGRRLIAVLGGTGGGRDRWKRKAMGSLADKYCDEIILTDEDPYDEEPELIVNDVASGVISRKPAVIMDRRLAVRRAVRRAAAGDVILVTGKGTDPYIMGPGGRKTPWSDAAVAREELERLKLKKES